MIDVSRIICSHLKRVGAQQAIELVRKRGQTGFFPAFLERMCTADACAQ